MIGLLAALVIISLLVFVQLSPDSETGETSPQRQIGKGKAAACAANRQTLKTHIAAWTIAHSGKMPSIRQLDLSGTPVPTCPEEGILSIGPDGTIYCSIHAPDPNATPTPTPTPTPRPEGPQPF